MEARDWSTGLSRLVVLPPDLPETIRIGTNDAIKSFKLSPNESVEC